MSFKTAQNHFNDNLKYFSKSKKEEANLYSGLVELTKSLESLEGRIKDIQVRVDTIEEEVKRKR